MITEQPIIPFIIDHIPQILLVSITAIILYLFAKDIINGLRRPFLDPARWQPLQLVDKKVLTHNTRRFRFALPHQDQILGLPVGQHITIKAVVPDGTEVMRPYTPTSNGMARGYVDFVIKVYPQGRMSQAMDALPLGGSLLFKGPKGRFEYMPQSVRHYGMLAGGTGITPMYQLAQEILKDPNDPTKISLVFANVTPDDILLKDELNDLANRNPSRFSVYYVLNEAPANWQGGVGFISRDMIKERLPGPSDGVMVLRCGPLPMMKAMEGLLNELGYSSDMQFQF